MPKKRRISCLVTIYGIPLKIAGSRHDGNTDTTAAAVDSELALVLRDTYPLKGWLANPYYLSFQKSSILLKRDQVLLVSRLDAPSPTIVRRIIDDTLTAEQQGLQGRGCFDARWEKPAQKRPIDDYHRFDQRIQRAADELRKTTTLKVTLDTREELFRPGQCPHVALYCGWYSLAHYVDAFSWVPGAIGYHVASAECASLHGQPATAWCPQMLQHGVSATIGPVHEPFLQAFPKPDIFFSRLSQGYLSLGECYLISLPYLSWQMVLIGDPMYQPFAPREKQEK